MNPKVSVIITAFNEGSRIKSSIESVLNQTFQDYELIVVDDGSTDSTSAIIRTYNDSRILFLRQAKNSGVGYAKNCALRYVSAPYIAICDADDFNEQTRFLMQYDYLSKHPEIAVLGTYIKMIINEGEYIRKFPIKHDDIKRRCLIGMPFAHSSLMIRTEAINSVGGYYQADSRYFYDYELVIRLLSKYRGANIPEPLVKYIRHKSSVMSSMSHYTWVKRNILTYYKAWDLLSSKNLYTFNLLRGSAVLGYLLCRRILRGW